MPDGSVVADCVVVDCGAGRRTVDPTTIPAIVIAEGIVGDGGVAGRKTVNSRTAIGCAVVTDDVAGNDGAGSTTVNSAGKYNI